MGNLEIDNCTLIGDEGDKAMAEDVVPDISTGLLQAAMISIELAKIIKVERIILTPNLPARIITL